MTRDQEEQLKQLQDMMSRQEDLEPELLDYYEDEGALGAPCIRHPLVYSILHGPNLNAMVNQQYRYKKEAVDRALKEEKWSTYIYLHERPYRIDAFNELCEMEVFADSHPEYWRLLGDIWTDSENVWQNEDLWRINLTTPWPGRHHMMTDDERGELAECLDDPIPVYRGFCRVGRDQGLSWTHNLVVAKFFARRFAMNGETQYIAAGQVAKKDVIAYFTGRSEYEIVALPESVRDIEIQEVGG